MSICFKEGIKILPEAMNDIITGANHDIRQVLHHLSLWSVKDKQLSIENVKEESQRAKKDIKLVSVLCLKVSSISDYVMKKIPSVVWSFHDFPFVSVLSILRREKVGLQDWHALCVCVRACTFACFHPSF